MASFNPNAAYTASLDHDGRTWKVQLGYAFDELGNSRPVNAVYSKEGWGQSTLMLDY